MVWLGQEGRDRRKARKAADLRVIARKPPVSETGLLLAKEWSA